jgi:hypothetical protein
LLSQIEKLNNYIVLAKDSKLDSKKDYTVKFNPLWQQTDSEKVEMRYKQAQIDEIYMNCGVFDPDEVRKNRFGDGNYSIETIVEGNAPEITDPTIMSNGNKLPSKTTNFNS